MHISFKTILPGILVLLMLIPAAHAELRPEGVWLARDGKAHVRVRRCKTGLCARIVWLRTPNDKNGRPLRDGNNPDPSLRRRRIIGLPLFINMKRTAATSWEGWLYDPERGGTFRGYLKPLTQGSMKVWGCLSAGWPCQSYIWKRIK